MTDYQPTDEQITALGNTFFSITLIGARMTSRQVAAELAKTDAFQAIIRAAQAEAWDRGLDHGADDLGRAAVMAEHGEDENPYREPTDV